MRKTCKVIENVRGWLRRRSPYSLIQEDLWSSAPESEWLILVACMMLNCTSRKQVERVILEFRRRWPTPVAFIAASDDDVITLCRPLGFANRRTKALKKMTSAYLQGDWAHASELPGIGPYASASWEIFCAGALPVECPRDHALVLYYLWVTKKVVR